MRTMYSEGFTIQDPNPAMNCMWANPWAYPEPHCFHWDSAWVQGSARVDQFAGQEPKGLILQTLPSIVLTKIGTINLKDASALHSMSLSFYTQSGLNTECGGPSCPTSAWMSEGYVRAQPPTIHGWIYRTGFWGINHWSFTLETKYSKMLGSLNTQIEDEYGN